LKGQVNKQRDLFEPSLRWLGRHLNKENWREEGELKGNVFSHLKHELNREDGERQALGDSNFRCSFKLQVERLDLSEQQELLYRTLTAQMPNQASLVTFLTFRATPKLSSNFCTNSS